MEHPGTLVGGFLQFAVQWPSLRRAGFRYRPMFDLNDPGVRQIMRLMGPVMEGVMNTYFDRGLAKMKALAEQG